MSQGVRAALSFYSKDSFDGKGNCNGDDVSTCAGHPSHSIISGSSAGSRGNRALIGCCRIPPDDVTQHGDELLSVKLRKTHEFNVFHMLLLISFHAFE